jgi:hypothetical protein
MLEIHEGHVRAAWVHFAIDHDFDDLQFMQLPIVRGSVDDFHLRAPTYLIYASYRRKIEDIDGVKVWRIVGEIPGTGIKDVEVARGIIAP